MVVVAINSRGFPLSLYVGPVLLRTGLHSITGFLSGFVDISGPHFWTGSDPVLA